MGDTNWISGIVETGPQGEVTLPVVHVSERSTGTGDTDT